MLSYTIEEIKVGDKGSIEKTVSESDVYNFAGITGDFSWLHVNEDRSRRGRFGKRIVHGMLLMGMISGVLGTQMPGGGCIYVSQEIKFLKPVFIGDTVKAEVEVVEVIKERNRVKLKTVCTNQNGEEVLVGEATMIPTLSKE
ncbi:MAG: MaoC family dehydratase [Chitinophagales bacterium]